jgi:hypothetical protein
MQDGRVRFYGLIGVLAEKLGKEELPLFVAIAREIWRRRNEVLHGRVFSHPSIVAKSAAEALRQFQQLNSQDSNQEDDELAENSDGVGRTWQPPAQGVYKANWDIAISSVNQCMGVGVLVRDGNGLVATAKSSTVFATFEPVAGEALAARQAAEFCRDLGFFFMLFWKGIP